MVIEWAIAKIAIEQPTTKATKALYASVLLQKTLPQRFYTKPEMTKRFKKHVSKDIAYEMVKLVQDPTLFSIPLVDNAGHGWYAQSFTTVLEALGMKKVSIIQLKAEDLLSFSAFKQALRKKMLYGINADIDGYVTISNQAQANLAGKTSRTVQRWRSRMPDVTVRPNYQLMDNTALEALAPEERKQLKGGIYRRIRSSYKIDGAVAASPHVFSDRTLASQAGKLTPEYGNASLRQTYHRRMPPEYAPSKNLAGAFDMFVSEEVITSTGEIAGVFLRYRSWGALWKYGIVPGTQNLVPESFADYQHLRKELDHVSSKKQQLTYIQNRESTPWRAKAIDRLWDQEEQLKTLIENHESARADNVRQARAKRQKSYAAFRARQGSM